MKIKEKKTRWGLKDLKLKEQTKPEEQTKAIENKYDDNLLMQEKTFNRLLDERMDEIREIRKKKLSIRI